MSDAASLLDELRTQYEAAREHTLDHADVEGFQSLDARMRKTFRWLEQAIGYLDGINPPIEHRFDLGHGLRFESLRFSRGFVGQHTHRIVGYPVLDEININYEVAAARDLALDLAPMDALIAEKALDDAGLHYTCRRHEDAHGNVHKCLLSVPPSIPSAIAFRVDYATGIVTVSLVNVDRFDRVSLEFPSTSIDEPLLEDLVRFILGRSDAFLRRAPLAGLHRHAGA
jgi:hypothetical protein